LDEMMAVISTVFTSLYLGMLAVARPATAPPLHWAGFGD
jgi:hypothetical protein